MMEFKHTPGHVPNEFSRLFNVSNTGSYLAAALEETVTNYRPRDQYPNEQLRGMLSGPTGIAYLFLTVSVVYPKLVVAGQAAFKWAEDYIRPASRGDILKIPSTGCGISDEKLSFCAVRAAVTKDLSYVRIFVSTISEVLSGHHPDSLLFGRAGTLYLLRMVRHWVPNSAPLVERCIVMMTNKIMESSPDWAWDGHRHLSAGYGLVGIVTQLVLTTPPIAPQLEVVVATLLDAQHAEGNWPPFDGYQGENLVQFMHGAPGFIFSLLSLQPYYPSLRETFDDAIKRARECVWNEGLLRNEPSIAWGILGNALTFAPGPQRDHFLALATPEKMAELRSGDPGEDLFDRNSEELSVLLSYAPSAAWTWMVCGRRFPRILAFNDI